MTRVLIFLAASAIILIVGYVVLGYFGFAAESDRWYAMGFYRDALTQCYLKETPPPATLRDLVAVFSPERAAEMAGSQDGDNSIPVYRPAGHLRGGPYLVIVEKPPRKWYYRGTYVVYAFPNGKPANTSMGGMRYAASAEELLKWLAEDDRLRAAHSSETSPASAPAL